MRRVYKYFLPVEHRFTLLLPRAAEVLHFGYQEDRLAVWAIADLAEPPSVPRVFVLRGTGHDIAPTDEGKFVGTVVGFLNSLVLHLFEVPT